MYNELTSHILTCSMTTQRAVTIGTVLKSTCDEAGLVPASSEAAARTPSPLFPPSSLHLVFPGDLRASFRLRLNFSSAARFAFPWPRAWPFPQLRASPSRALRLPLGLALPFSSAARCTCSSASRFAFSSASRSPRTPPPPFRSRHNFPHARFGPSRLLLLGSALAQGWLFLSCSRAFRCEDLRSRAVVSPALARRGPIRHASSIRKTVSDFRA